MTTRKGSLVVFKTENIRIGMDRVTVAYLAKDGEPTQTNHMVIHDIDENHIVISAGEDKDEPLVPSGATVFGRSDSGEGYSFRSQIVGVERRDTGRSRRVKVWVLDRPKKVKRNQRRTAFRMDVSLSARISWRDGEHDHFFSGTCVDVSFTGCRVHVDMKKQHVDQHEPMQSLMSSEDCVLALCVPESFIDEELERRKKKETKPRNGRSEEEDRTSELDQILSTFRQIEAKVMAARSKKRKGYDPLVVIGLKFDEHPMFSRFVRHLERLMIQNLGSES